MVRKLINCDICGCCGSVSINTEVSYDEIAYCPVCSSPLLAEDEEDFGDEF
jgi:uncharacterized paraquat-inducible protein A